jgi:chemotaxis protein methyltransferase CheR
MIAEQLRRPDTRDNLCRDFAAMVRERLGLHFAPYQWSDMLRALRPFAEASGFEDLSSCMRWAMQADPAGQQAEQLARHLTVGESYFYRERETLELLERTLLPERMAARAATRRLRLWSAGCSTGEEAYSLAVAAHRAIGNDGGWSADIFGSDINSDAIHTAEQGRYSAWSFRDVSFETLQPQLLCTADGRYEVSADLRRNVRFGLFNLTHEQPYPYGMDVIFCRNVLIYFDRDTAAKVIERMHQALPEGGYLVLSLTETGLATDSAFIPIVHGAVTVYQKQAAAATASVRPAIEARSESTRITAVDEMRFEEVPTSGRNDVGTAVCGSGWRVRRNGKSAIAPDAAAEVKAATGRAMESVLRKSHGDIDLAAAASNGADSQELEHGKAGEVPGLLADARARADAGDLDEALACTDRAVAVDRLDARAHFLRGTILRACGRPQDAMHALERAVYLDDAFVSARFALGTLLLQLRGATAAARQLRALDMLLSRLPDDRHLPESDLTPRRMRDIILSLLS